MGTLTSILSLTTEGEEALNDCIDGVRLGPKYIKFS